jgi:hypothetical protein
MALTEAQKEKVRYYCGYGVLGDQALPANGYRFFVEYGEMEYKLINLQDGEEDEVVNNYLPTLLLLQSDLSSASLRSNLDTKQAAVWYWNDKEIRDRKKLFNYWRMELVNYLGLTPGPGLSSGGIRFAV